MPACVTKKSFEKQDDYYSGRGCAVLFALDDQLLDVPMGNTNDDATTAPSEEDIDRRDMVVTDEPLDATSACCSTSTPSPFSAIDSMHPTNFVGASLVKEVKASDREDESIVGDCPVGLPLSEPLHPKRPLPATTFQPGSPKAGQRMVIVMSTRSTAPSVAPAPAPRSWTIIARSAPTPLTILSTPPMARVPLNPSWLKPRIARLINVVTSMFIRFLNRRSHFFQVHRPQIRRSHYYLAAQVETFFLILRLVSHRLCPLTVVIFLSYDSFFDISGCENIVPSVHEPSQPIIVSSVAKPSQPSLQSVSGPSQSLSFVPRLDVESAGSFSDKRKRIDNAYVFKLPPIMPSVSQALPRTVSMPVPVNSTSLLSEFDNSNCVPSDPQALTGVSHFTKVDSPCSDTNVLATSVTPSSVIVSPVSVPAQPSDLVSSASVPSQPVPVLVSSILVSSQLSSNITQANNSSAVKVSLPPFPPSVWLGRFYVCLCDFTCWNCFSCTLPPPSDFV